jgi:shikimate kinase
MNNPANLFLVGPMGAGKSAVGRHLAKLLHLEFVDSDEEVEKRTGVDIAFIFEKEGESGFREREAKVIDELTQLDGVVLATGGGAILDPDSRSRLGARGFVVYLHTTVRQQLERTRRGRERPLLENRPKRQVLEELMSVRDPLYREIADLVIETDGRRVQAVAREIHESLR